MMEGYSFTKQKGMKEFKYIRFCFMRELYSDEVVYCKNDGIFLKFLNDMNNSHKHSKYQSEKESYAEYERKWNDRRKRPRYDDYPTNVVLGGETKKKERKVS